MRQFRVLPVLEYTGKKPTKSNPNYVRKTNTTYPDSLILAIRTAHEIDGKSRRQVEKLFPELKKSYIYQVLYYQIRSNLRVKPIKD